MEGKIHVNAGKREAEEREIAVGMGQSKGATQIILMTTNMGWKK